MTTHTSLSNILIFDKSSTDGLDLVCLQGEKVPSAGGEALLPSACFLKDFAGPNPAVVISLGLSHLGIDEAAVLKCSVSCRLRPIQCVCLGFQWACREH